MISENTIYFNEKFICSCQFIQRLCRRRGEELERKNLLYYYFTAYIKNLFDFHRDFFDTFQLFFFYSIVKCEN